MADDRTNDEFQLAVQHQTNLTRARDEAAVDRSVNLLLTHARSLAYGSERLNDWVRDKFAPKMAGVPEERLQEPQATVGVPLLEAVRLTLDEPDLQEMFAKLLAGAMDTKYASDAHPAFVQIIREMTSDEAKVIKYFGEVGDVPVVMVSSRRANGSTRTMLQHFSLAGREAGCRDPDKIAYYMANLCRLQLIQPMYTHQALGYDYDELLEHPIVADLVEALNETAVEAPFLTQGSMILTHFGEMFVDACIKEHLYVDPGTLDELAP